MIPALLLLPLCTAQPTIQGDDLERELRAVLQRELKQVHE